MRTFMSFHTAKLTEVIRKIKGTHLAVKISHGRDNVKSCMQSSAGKEIEIRAAPSSPCPTGQPKNSDRDYRIPVIILSGPLIPISCVQVVSKAL